MYVCPHKTTRHLWPVEKMVTAPAFTGQETSLNSHMPEVIHSNIYYMETLNWFQFLLVYPIRKFQNVLEAIESMTSTKFCNRKNVWIFQTHIMAKHLSSYPNILSLFPMTEFCLLCIGPRGIKKIYLSLRLLDSDHKAKYWSMQKFYDTYARWNYNFLKAIVW